MNASKKTLAAYFNYIGSIELPIEIAQKCGHSGSCDNDLREAMQLPEVIAELSELEPSALRKELEAYGAWDDDQLQYHDANLERILWLACCDMLENI